VIFIYSLYVYILGNNMSTINEQRRERQEERKKITSVNSAFDQTKENIRRRTIDEARKDTPSYNQMIDEYQEQTTQQRRF
jgi:sensor domain CHASE-containing protein